MEIIKFIALVLSIWFTVINTVRIIYKVNVPSINLLLNAVAITTFIFLQFHL